MNECVLIWFQSLKLVADLVLRGHHPSVYLAAINNQTPRAKELARIAYATIKATSVLKER